MARTMETARPSIPTHLLKDLREVVEYLWHDEEKDFFGPLSEDASATYEETGQIPTRLSAESRDHIFLPLQRLNAWLESKEA